MIQSYKHFLCGFIFLSLFLTPSSLEAFTRKTPVLSAESAVIIDSDNGRILYSKNANLRLPPASTTKVMTALIALDRLKFNQLIPVSVRATQMSPSKAGLTANEQYRAIDLIVAVLVSSSNDAAAALAEAISGDEKEFVKLMNEKAKALGMNDTKFVNATGLTEKRQVQYSTAMDLARLMRVAARNRVLDQMMGITTASFRGSDNKVILIRSHNKMLWRMPKFVKGKTGWTYASRHTFVGTDYAFDKKISFAMLYSKKPWVDIERLATFGLSLEQRQ